MLPPTRLGTVVERGARRSGPSSRGIACDQPSDVGLFDLTDTLVMGVCKAADRRVGEHVHIVGLPAEEAGDRSKGHLLREQIGPFLVSWCDDPIVCGEDRIVGGKQLPAKAGSFTRKRVPVALPHVRWSIRAVRLALQAALRPMLTAAITSASPAKLHDIHTNDACVLRLTLSICPQTGHVREVLRQ